MKIKVNSSSAPVNLDINELHIHQRHGHHHHHEYDNPHALVVYEPQPAMIQEPEDRNVPDDSCEAGCFNILKVIGGVCGALVKGFIGV